MIIVFYLVLVFHSFQFASEIFKRWPIIRILMPATKHDLVPGNKTINNQLSNENQSQTKSKRCSGKKRGERSFVHLLYRKEQKLCKATIYFNTIIPISLGSVNNTCVSALSASVICGGHLPPLKQTSGFLHFTNRQMPCGRNK